MDTEEPKWEFKDDERKKAYERAMEKAQDGLLALTAEDHLALGSSLNLGNDLEQKLHDNPRKAAHELMTDGEIQAFLDNSLSTILDKNMVPIHDLARKELSQTIPFLTKIGRLPEKYKDYQI